LDKISKDSPDDNKLWDERYQLEADHENIYKVEELFWQQRGEENGFWKVMPTQHFSALEPMGGGKPRSVL
jgi:hypothetical protein